MRTAIFYGSSGGTTKSVAEQIKKALGYDVDLIDVADAKGEEFERYDKIILGTSTWGEGDLQDDWEDFFEEFQKVDLSGKKVALFGTGDQEEYPESFVDAMGILYEQPVSNGAEIVGGGWPLEGYEFDNSRAVVDGAFVGLVIDEDNQPDLTPFRVSKWVESIKEEFSSKKGPEEPLRIV